jgi:hypothetical protein
MHSTKNRMGLYRLDSSGSGYASVVALVSTVMNPGFNKMFGNP